MTVTWVLGTPVVPSCIVIDTLLLLLLLLLRVVVVEDETSRYYQGTKLTDNIRQEV